MGTLSVVFASTNLLIRTVMIWRDNWYVIGVLIAANIGHLLAAVIGAVLEGRKSRWNSDTLICDGDPTHSVAFYLYTSILDLVILFLSVAGLYRHGVLSTGSKWRKICNQGVIYVLVTFLINIPTIVLGWLNLNATMNMIGAPLGTTISVIASSRAVMSLLRPRDDMSSSLPVYASSSESSGTRERTFEDKNMHASPVGMLTTHIDLTQNDSRSSVLPSEYSISLSKFRDLTVAYKFANLRIILLSFYYCSRGSNEEFAVPTRKEYAEWKPF
ncbi:hypothetical protein QCA50_019885 [Cerrena zonata]|uniref:Uncharacterized protein n=1 Tax=Cerrena zonata TaxID=2478898 RepID=A0AAW0FIJ6_9APHY